MEFFKKTAEVADGLFEFVGWALKRVESSGPAHCKSARNAIGEISVAIPQGGTGEIVVEIGKSLHHYPAKTVTGDLALKRGSRVRVVDVGQNMMYVESLEEAPKAEPKEKIDCCASAEVPVKPVEPARKKAKR